MALLDKKVSEGTLWWLSWVVVSASFSLILLAKRATPPAQQQIGLQYDVAAAKTVVEGDRAREGQALSADAKRAAALNENQNLSQLGRMPPSWDGAAERQELHALGERLRATPDALRVLHAHVAKAALAALTGGSSREQAEKSLGGSIALLRRYQFAVGPHLRAPRFVLRTFFKARLNQLLGLPPVEAFEKEERLAHYGWGAFHADSTPAAARLQLLDAYQAEGGQHAHAVRGAIAFRAGASKDAVKVYERLAAQTGNVRYRNHALFILEQVRQTATEQ